MAEDKLKKIENELLLVRYELRVIKNIISPDKAPGWAKDSRDIAEAAGLRPSPYGEGYDTLRILELLNKLGLLSGKGD